jgi:excisionase family DNA binding protein
MMLGTHTEADEALVRWRDRVKSQSDVASTRRRYNEPRPARERAEQPRTVAEAAVELGLSVHTIRAWVTARRLAHIRLGRVIRIPASEIRRLIEENTVPAIEEQ